MMLTEEEGADDGAHHLTILVVYDILAILERFEPVVPTTSSAND